MALGEDADDASRAATLGTAVSEVVWAKLTALAEGARLASRQGVGV
jgi:hypothetical protein